MERSHTKLFLALIYPEVAAARTGRQSVSGKKRSSLLQSEPLAAALLGGAWSGPTRPAATVQHKLWSGVTQLFLVLDDEYQRLVKEHLDPIFGASRLQQMNEMAGGEERVGTITGDEKTLNRSLGASVVIVGTALVAGGAIAPIVLICFPLAIYTSLVPLKRAYRALFYERKLKIPVLASISLLGTWLGGFYLAGGVGSVIFFVAEKLILISQDRSRQKLVSILGQQPRFVWILVNESEVEIPFGQLKVGDVLVVGAGQLIPVDGLIRSGHGLIDQHRLTGESQPAEKAAGDQVMAGTVVLAGRLYIAVEKAGSDTIAAQIGHALNNTASYQMAIDSQALQLANASVPPTLIAAGLAWLWIGLEGAVSITSATFGFNVRLTGPITMLNYLNLASQQGILVKDGRSLELLNQVDTVIFDKTGTLTLDQPTVSHIHVFGQMDETALLAYAAAAEDRQTHPIARAIVDAAKRREVALPSIGAARYEIGYGIQVEIDGHLVQVGSERFMAMKGVVVAGAAQLLQADTHDRGHSLVMVAVDDELVGALELEPMVRPEARAVIEALQRRNVEVYIISGDHEEPTRQLAWELGVEHYFANVLPADKAKHVERLQGAGRHVCFVGDGINDSIALKKAQVSVSLRGATTVATDTAQVVLMSATLEHLPSLFALAQQFDTNMKAGLAISIFPSLLIIGGVFFGNLGLLGATILYDVGLLAGVGVAMLPALQSKKEEERPKWP
ncbi:MAG: heavy metal translocating P-type ATPase [Caldilinea sp.]